MDVVKIHSTLIVANLQLLIFKLALQYSRLDLGLFTSIKGLKRPYVEKSLHILEIKLYLDLLKST